MVPYQNHTSTELASDTLVWFWDGPLFWRLDKVGKPLARPRSRAIAPTPAETGPRARNLSPSRSLLSARADRLGACVPLPAYHEASRTIGHTLRFGGLQSSPDCIPKRIHQGTRQDTLFPHHGGRPLPDSTSQTAEKRDWFHKLGNVLDKLPKRLQTKAKWSSSKLLSLRQCHR